MKATWHAQRIECLALRAWPALETCSYDGWLIRFADGYTKRANSVNLVQSSTLPLAVKIDHCNRFYRQRGLPTIFRLSSCMPEANTLDGLLAARRYALVDPTLVLARSLQDWRPVEGLSPAEPAPDLDAWLAAYGQLSGGLFARETHRRIVERSSGLRLPVWAVAEGEPVACGLGVLEDGGVGLYDLIVSSERRRQGLGTAIVSRILTWACDEGAQEAYLQVTEANSAAQGLYHRLGYRFLYRYHYRVRSCDN